MYTWGYIKDAALSKLDLDDSEEFTKTLVDKFYIYANEAMTQICSSIKPNRTFAVFDVTSEHLYETVAMPTDFISFGDDVNQVRWQDDWGDYWYEEVNPTWFEYVGYNKVRFKHTGHYEISYNARWENFTKEMTDDTELDVPIDVLECIPSYIAHQCYKIDDEYKASVFRNEYEIFVSRIDATDYRSGGTIRIGGDW